LSQQPDISSYLSPASRGFFISGLKMQKKFQISFYKNTNGVTVGLLKFDNQSLLATTHPATTAYALQALGAQAVEIAHKSTHFEISLPSVMVLSSQLSALGQHAKWLSHFMLFSQIDSFNPPPIDEQADIHLRTAIYFLPEKMVQRKPTGAKPLNWKAELKLRKQFIYFPIC
jgi:hypothetical protein